MCDVVKFKASLVFDSIFFSKIRYDWEVSCWLAANSKYD